MTADAIHENVAAVDLAGGLARQQPELTRDILWGAATLAALDGRVARQMLEAWEDGASSLRIALPDGRAERPGYGGVSRRDLTRRRWARLQAHHLVRPVAEGPLARPAAAAERDRAIAAGVDRVAVLVLEAEGAAHEQRPVAVARDAGFVHCRPVCPGGRSARRMRQA